MRTVQIEIYEFDELSKEAKKRVIDKYTDIYDYTDYELTEEDCEQVLDYFGYRDIKIRWSGFYSQGDGACFTAKWNASDFKIEDVKENYTSKEKDLHMAADRLSVLAQKYPELSVVIKHQGMYCHENSILLDVESEKCIPDEEFNEVYQEFKQISQSLMRWIYGQLEVTNEFLYKEETIIENIKANDYEFYASGKIY